MKPNTLKRKYGGKIKKHYEFASCNPLSPRATVGSIVLLRGEEVVSNITSMTTYQEQDRRLDRRSISGTIQLPPTSISPEEIGNNIFAIKCTTSWGTPTIQSETTFYNVMLTRYRTVSTYTDHSLTLYTYEGIEFLATSVNFAQTRFD